MWQLLCTYEKFNYIAIHMPHLKLQFSVFALFEGELHRQGRCCCPLLGVFYDAATLHIEDNDLLIVFTSQILLKYSSIQHSVSRLPTVLALILLEWPLGSALACVERSFRHSGNNSFFPFCK